MLGLQELDSLKKNERNQAEPEPDSEPDVICSMADEDEIESVALLTH